eukprot:jgi/Astpho2/7967/Aster-06564
MDDKHTRDVTSEMQPLCLIGKEMRAAFWRGWAEIAWRLENDIDPNDRDSFFDHCEECMPDFIKLVNQKCPRA